MNNFTQAISDIVLSILLAALLSLVFESPVLAIEKRLLRKNKTRDNRTEETPVVSKKSVEESTVNQDFAVKSDR
jgi:peptidoglycan/LPS O-acetylase OafA/YrhL